MMYYYEMGKCNESGYCIHYQRGECLLLGIAAEYKCPHYISQIECEFSDCSFDDEKEEKDDKEKNKNVAPATP